MVYVRVGGPRWPVYLHFRLLWWHKYYWVDCEPPYKIFKVNGEKKVWEWDGCQCIHFESFCKKKVLKQFQILLGWQVNHVFCSLSLYHNFGHGWTLIELWGHAVICRIKNSWRVIYHLLSSLHLFPPINFFL